MKKSALNFQTAFLSQAEYENPFLALDEFFGERDTSAWREYIWDIFSSAMSGSIWEHDDPSEKGNNMYYFRLLLKLFDISSRMHQLQVTGEFVVFASKLHAETTKIMAEELTNRMK